MDFTDLGYEWDVASESTAPDKDGKKRVDYPTLYIRSKDELPEFEPDEDGCVYFMAKARIAGFSEKTEGDKTLELEIQAICPCATPEGMDMGKKEPDEGYEDLEVVVSRMKKKKMDDMEIEG